VAEDHVRTKSSAPHLQCCRRHGPAALDGAHDRSFEALGCHLHLVAERLDARQGALAQQVRLLAERDHLVARPAYIVRRQVAVLPREVLVDEEEPHPAPASPA
jgi:hypothetical protein